MENKILIIVAGLPCTGKTTLAGKISEEFGIPLITKDGIKERLMDSLGAEDREKSRALGAATYSLLYYVLESHLGAGNSLVVESNFASKIDSGQILPLLEKYGYRPLQVQCRTEGKVLIDRYMKRTGSGERHPGHFDSLNYPALEETLLTGGYETLEIGGEVIYLDTTDFGSIDYDGLYDKIKKYSDRTVR